MPGPVVRKDPPLLHRHGRILKVDHPLLLLRSTVRGATFTLAKRAARARGSRPRVRALPGARHVCNGRGGALRGAGARREGARPAAGCRRRRAASSGRRPVRRGSPLAATNSPASGAVRPRKGAARPCKRPFLRCAAGGSVSPTARHAARRIIEGAWTLSGALFFCGVIVGSVNPLRWARAHRDGTWFFFSRERPSLTDGLGRQTRIRPRGGGLAAGQLVVPCTSVWH